MQLVINQPQMRPKCHQLHYLHGILLREYVLLHTAYFIIHKEYFYCCIMQPAYAHSIIYTEYFCGGRYCCIYCILHYFGGILQQEYEIGTYKYEGPQISLLGFVLLSAQKSERELTAAAVDVSCFDLNSGNLL